MQPRRSSVSFPCLLRALKGTELREQVCTALREPHRLSASHRGVAAVARWSDRIRGPAFSNCILSTGKGALWRHSLKTSKETAPAGCRIWQGGSTNTAACVPSSDSLDPRPGPARPLGMAVLVGRAFDITLRAAHGYCFDGHPLNVIVSAVPRVNLVSAHLAFETSKALNRWPILLRLVSSATA